MGGLLSRKYNNTNKIVLLGFDSSGKTTLLYFLKTGEIQITFPTIGFNKETIKKNNKKYLIWDIGGQDSLRKLWPNFFNEMQILIYVIDASDKLRLNNTISELCTIINNETFNKQTPILIFANKQDLPGAASAINIKEIIKKNLNNNLENILLHVQESIFSQNKGINEGFSWITKKKTIEKHNYIKLFYKQ